MLISVRNLTFLLLAFGAATPVAAEETDRLPPLIRVAGEGNTSAPPDMATIRTGVVTQAESAREALEENNAVMQKILPLLKERGVAERDVQTSSFVVAPVYERDDQFRQVRPGTRIIAYRVHNEVQVRVRNLATLGEILDALVAAGSNQISGVTFDVDDPSRILNEARRRAVRDAQSRAEAYAEAAGVNVGPVVQIREQPVEWPRPMQMGMELRTADAAVPIATGEQEFRVTVNVVFELRQRDGD